MPTIQLFDEATDRAWVWAVMLFPENDHLRATVFTRRYAESQVHGLADDSKLVVTAGTIRGLLNTLSPDDFDRVRKKAIREGMVAGDILNAVYFMHCTGCVAEPSVRKAQYAYLAWGRQGAVWGDGESLPKSQSELYRIWSSYGSVAHFWAAFRLNTEYPFAEEDEIFGVGWPTFLEVAAGMLKFGCEFVPKRTKPPRSILNREECWLLPASIRPRQLRAEGLTPAFGQFLRTYKAPRRTY